MKSKNGSTSKKDADWKPVIITFSHALTPNIALHITPATDTNTGVWWELHIPGEGRTAGWTDEGDRSKTIHSVMSFCKRAIEEKYKMKFNSVQ